MIEDLQFDELIRSFEEFSDGCEKAKADQASTGTLIASAEYELEQLKKLIAGAWLEPATTPMVIAAKPEAADTSMAASAPEATTPEPAEPATLAA